ncbi:Liprin-beta-1 [Orchesella cincta]|uniref:Liprin-beta-1 n=1 Tax=Orchesella cincta TaxID=48709 RepID=A0A1D2MNN0_ORCCI|nr:Liprin-beta-1 [Orchesella cincta]
MLCGSLLGLDYEDRLLRLESDKDTLHLQVSVLSDQIEAQTNKIHDLEKMLDDKRNVLESTEDQLQRIFAESFDTFTQELLLRSSLETQKLELMTTVSSLRLKQASLERENIELKDRVVGKSTGDLSFIDSGGSGGGGNGRNIWEKPPKGPERSTSPAHSLVDPAFAARSRLAGNGNEQPHPPQHSTGKCLPSCGTVAFGTIPRRSPHSSQLSANTALQFNGNLGGQMGSDSHGKSGKTNSLSSGNIHAITSFNNGRQSNNLNISSSSNNTVASHNAFTLSPNNNKEGTVHQQMNALSSYVHGLQQQQQNIPTYNPQLPLTSSALFQHNHQHKHHHHHQQQLLQQEKMLAAQNSKILCPREHALGSGFEHELGVGVPSGGGAFLNDDNNSFNNHSTPIQSLLSSSPPPVVTSISPPFSSPHASPNLHSSGSTSGAWAYRKARARCSVAPSTSGSFVSTISRVFNPRSSCRSTSTPNLVSVTDNKDVDWEKSTGGVQNTGTATSNKSKQSPNGSGSSSSHKSRGILRILGKLRRSNSGGLDNDVAPETTGPFVRGGVRATAHPRLGWMKDPSPVKKPDGPVTSWDSDAVITWLNYLGLGSYAGEVKRWVKSGQQLLDASNHELEKELGIKNTLHRKKLSLALYSLKHPDEEDNAGKLDYHWVIRWLDDVGLPQYKESFMEARIDGRVLGHLTSEDLVSLKVTSVLHHASIKRGIQLLRIHKFHPDCLCRRGGPNPGAVRTVWGPKHVATWTNHRAMEWLKAIDLAEYAPNLRGSGVHGALIIFEPRFNSELMATMLAIPGNKTLLRRHLSLQFNELVGRHIVQEKRVAETASDFIPLNPTTKVKLPKKSQFPLRKKRLSTEMTEDLLCPKDLNTYPFNSDSLTQITTAVNEMSVDGTKAEEKVSDI